MPDIARIYPKRVSGDGGELSGSEEIEEVKIHPVSVSYALLFPGLTPPDAIWEQRIA